MTTAINLYYLLQNSVRNNSGAWQPVGVSSLLIDRTAPSGTNQPVLGPGSDSFSTLMVSLADYLLQTFGAYNSSANLTADNLTKLKTALDNGGFSDDAATYAWLTSSGLSFTVNALQFTGNPPKLTSTPAATFSDAAVFPMIPGMTVTYNGVATTFGDTTAPAAYITNLKAYFAQLSFVGDGSVSSSALAAADVTPSSSWFPGVVFADYFNLLAKQIYQDLYDLVVKKDVQGTLSNDLAQVDIGNLSGIATRFLQHGLRVPDPADPNFPPTLPLRGLFDLSGQQFDVTGGILTATIAATAPKFTVAMVGAGVASLPFVLDVGPEQGPLWTPGILDRIRNVPQSFMLRQGVAWAQASANKTWQLFGFPEQLQVELRNSTTLNLQLTSTVGSGQPAVAPGLEGLMIRFSLGQVPQIDAATGKTTYLSNVFQVFGTNDDTRDLLEVFFDSGGLTGVEVDLLLPSSGGGYTTSAADLNTLILKTNLSSASQPVLAAFAMQAANLEMTSLPDLGPTYAPISNASDFLRLFWECSVVHSGGFYLYVPDLAATNFPSPLTKLNVALLVKSSSAQPNSTVAVDAYHNTILVSTTSPLPSGARIQAAVFQSDNQTPVTVPQPNYPAGAIAFQTLWTVNDNPPVPNNATAGDNSAYAATLYQLLQFQLEPGPNLQGSGWSMPLGPNNYLDQNQNFLGWEYRRAVPLYRFITPPSTNRYAAIGQTATVDFQLVDMFGNAYAPSTAQGITTMAVYNDQLTPVDQWPAVAAVYEFQAGTGSNAGLSVSLSFQPDQISQPATALVFYQVVSDQLTDPRTSLSVTTALAAGPVSLTSGSDDIKTACSNFVAAIIAYLTAITAQPPTTGVVPPPITLSGTVSTSYVSQISEDLFPIWVSIEISRQAPDSYNYPDGFLSVVSQVPPLLSAADTDPAALRTWAMNFETAFNNFDGNNALLKVASGKAPTQITVTRSLLGTSAAGAVTSTPGDLWAMKWSPTAGVAVSFPNNPTPPNPPDAPVYFAPLPLATELTFGSVEIYDYDGNGNKIIPIVAPPKTAFSAIDLDGWASSFLQAFEGLLSPVLATKIAQQDGTAYASLMNAKEQLAYAISSNIAWVFQSQMPPSQGESGMGDITGAQKTFREGLLNSLATDFGTSAIVQAPATVSVQNSFEINGDSPSQPPDFYGSPSPATGTLQQYTISNALLPIAAGNTYLNFLVGTIAPGLSADLQLPLFYDIGFIDHRFQTSEEKFGYIPSSWLRFVVPDTDPDKTPPPVLDVAMGALDIPIPLRAYPSAPSLVSQLAQPTYPATTPANTPTTIPEALQWNYVLQLALPQIAQDDLHLSVLGNGAKVDRTIGTERGNNLFNALATFQDFQTRFLPQAINSITTGTSAAATWLGDIVTLVQAVATAWQPEAENAPTLVVDDTPVANPAPFKWDYTLQVPHENQPVITLTWNDASTPIWPTINGINGVAVANSNPPECTYTFPALPLPDVLTLVWSALSIITVQSLSTAAWIERNETLVQGQATNPAFVYGTQTVSFKDPLVPLLSVPTPLKLLNTQGVTDAVTQFITQVMQPPTPASEVGWGLEAGYSFMLVGQPGPQSLNTRLPVFLVRTALTTSTPPATPPPESLQNFGAELIAALKNWHQNFHPSDTNASLLFELTLFSSATQQSMGRLLDIEAPISGGNWWNS
jgi:hypothetical protein